MEALGGTFGNYRIDRLLGEGGMGAVYQAFDLSLQREVAIKIIHPHLARRPDFHERFIQEARLMARLDHPGIVRVYALGKEGDVLFLPMEYIKGGNLRQLLDDLIRQQKWLPLGEAVLLVRQLCQTVEYTHQHGVLHRDIKPANLMLKPEPTGELPFRVVLTDLGLAKLAEGLGITREGTSLGTPAYMSPEQASAQPTDSRSDIYSLGILLYELAVGRLPFPIKTITEAVRYHTQVPPAAPRSLRPELPETLEQVILKALEKDPARRYSSAAELAVALTSAMVQDQSGPMEVSTETSEAEKGHGTSLITEYEKGVITRSAPVEASLFTVLGSESVGPRGESVFGEQSLTPSSEARIQIVQKDTTAKILTLPTGTVTIGREKSNHFVLDDQKVSRKHAQITWDGTEYRVMDMNSSNGTFLDNARLLPGIAEIWRPDQVLRIGDIWLRLIRPSASVQSGIQNRPVSSFHTSLGAGLVGVLVAPPELAVEAGGSVSASISLLNQSPNVDHFTLSLTGIPSSWITSLPFQVELMPQDQREATLTLHVPRTPQSRAGRYNMTLKVTSKGDPSQFVEVRVTLVIAPYSLFKAELHPQRLRAGQTGQVAVSNQGNRTETFIAQFTDSANELTFQPQQLELKVPEGQIAKEGFQAQVHQVRWIGGEKIHPYRAQVSLPLGEPQTLHAEMLSRGFIPVWVPPIVLLICMALASLTAWFYREGQLSQQATQTVVVQTSDLDQDGLIFAEEITNGCSPENPDSDGDGLLDPEEKAWDSDCAVPDSDHDSISDGDEVHNPDPNQRTHPMNPDTDGDNLLDNVDPDPGSLPTITPSPIPTTAILTSQFAPTMSFTPTMTVRPTQPAPTQTPMPMPTMPVATTQAPIPREEYIDSSTQEQGMHACPAGFAIAGVHVGNNLLLCRRVMLPGEEIHVATFLSTPDNKEDRANMHACPEGMYMRGLHVGNNWLLCSYDGRSQSPAEWITEFEDRGSQAYDMHICFQSPENISYLTGIHVGENRFLCGIHQE